MTRHSYCLNNLAILLNLLILIILAPALKAQVAEGQPRHGVPQDWTHSHLIFNSVQLTERPDLAAAEPRRMHQALRRAQFAPTSAGLSTAAVDRTVSAAAMGASNDWSVSLGAAVVAPGMSPAKYGFDDSAPPSCTDDYAVFGLQATGVTAGQANLVAFNSLYTGPGGLCGTAGPSILFAYNVTTTAGGVIGTSPVLSLDGKKIAFVESAGASSIFHVLTWATGAGNGTSATASAVPGVGNTASMVSITYAPTVTDTRSSPWVDYINDVAYVAADDGKLYKFTGVFKGAPTLAGAPWPVTIAANLKLTAPVLDQFTRNIFVGDSQGGLRSLNVDNPVAIKSLAVGLAGSNNPVISDGPVVDADNGTVFAISSNDGISAVVVQADTATLAQLARARIGRGSTGATSVVMYDGAFDNNYYTSPATGFLLVCGTAANNTKPFRYQIGFTGRIMRTVAAVSGQMLNSISTRCSPITEYFNSNIGGGTDFFFWGLTANCLGPGTPGCVRIRSLAGVQSNLAQAGGTSAIIIDNNSTAGQASNIYFSDQIAPQSATKLAQ